MKYKHVIWDWNGTLLDDVGIAVNAMNNLLKRRGLPLLDEKTYKSIFTFPVKEYYATLGFNFQIEPFEELASEFVAEYRSFSINLKLFPDAGLVLRSIDSMGMSQSILSASKEKQLADLVAKFGIKQYFTEIAGLSDYYANSKKKRGKECLQNLNFKPEEIILVGDTIHDYEVASALGCDCVLISNGHQSREQLDKLEVNVLNTLSGVSNYILTGFMVSASG